MRRWLAAALLGLAWLPCIAQAQYAPPKFNLKAPKIISQGQALFNERCAGRCHGIDGGEGLEGPTLRGKAYFNASYVYSTLVTGRPGSAMPSWKGRLSDDDLWKIVAFVASLGDRARAAGERRK